MSNHLHLIASSNDEKIELSDILRDFKSYSAKVIHKKMRDQNTKESRRDWLNYMFKFFAKGKQRNREFQFWQSDNHPIELWSPRVINQKLDYIHLYPVKAGIVDETYHYIYSSASDYYENSGILDVEVLPPLSEIGFIMP